MKTIKVQKIEAGRYKYDDGKLRAYFTKNYNTGGWYISGHDWYNDEGWFKFYTDTLKQAKEVIAKAVEDGKREAEEKEAEKIKEMTPIELCEYKKEELAESLKTAYVDTSEQTYTDINLWKDGDITFLSHQGNTFINSSDLVLFIQVSPQDKVEYKKMVRDTLSERQVNALDKMNWLSVLEGSPENPKKWNKSHKWEADYTEFLEDVDQKIKQSDFPEK